MTPELLSRLLSPISSEHPGGTDVSFSPACDTIRQARKGDDLGLSQGDWVTEVRTPQWGQVRNLCEEILQTQSKDLQVAGWYTEALVKLEGLSGLAFGLQVMEGLLSRFWEICFPAMDGADLEARIGKLEWLNGQLPLAIQGIPMTSKASGGFSWLKWEESKAVDNLGLRDAAGKEQAMAEGKLSGEAFGKAAMASGITFFEPIHRQAQAALEANERLVSTVDDHFMRDSPSLDGLAEAIRGCLDLADTFLNRLGKGSVSPASTVFSELNASSAPTQLLQGGAIQSRLEAIQSLLEVASYFRRYEPHSPVALLVERAARWAQMPLDQWLANVIKDEGTLHSLRELLDLQVSDK